MREFTDSTGNRLLLHKSDNNIMITCMDNRAVMGGCYSAVSSVILDDLDALEVIKEIERLIKGE